MKLEYIGVRPFISQSGVFFKPGKQDKFIYLIYIVDIINAINHKYEKNKKYSYIVERNKKINSESLEKEIFRNLGNIKNRANKRLEIYKEKLDKEINNVSNIINFSEIEKEVYKKNLEIMKKYRIKRSYNKIFYFYCIKFACRLIKIHRIKILQTPLISRYSHVVKTIKRELMIERIVSNTSIVDLNGEKYLQLKINF